jgi:2-keto-4-pentenoate hydratase
MLECELAVLVDAAGVLQAVAPAIEIVGVRFARREDATAANLLLCNLGADRCIVGDWREWSGGDEQTLVTLSCNGEVVNRASATDAFGPPENAVAWIWQEIGNRGFRTQSETLLMTGACGSVIPAAIGNYRADFGTLGSLEFEVI